MTKDKDRRSEEYSSTRNAFDELNLEEKAFFLLESTAKAVIDGVQDAVKTVSDIMEEAIADLKKDMKGEKTTGDKADSGKAADKPAAKKTSTKSKTKKAAPKKASTKKSAKETDASA